MNTMPSSGGDDMVDRLCHRRTTTERSPSPWCILDRVQGDLLGEELVQQERAGPYKYSPRTAGRRNWAGNRHDVTQLMPLIDAFPPIRGRRGRPRRRPERVYADRAYDSDKYRKLVRDTVSSR